MKAAFEAAHKARFGFIDESKELVVEAVSVEAVGGGAKFGEPERARDRSAPARARAHDTLLLRRRHGTTRRSSRATQLAPGHKVAGPAIIIEPHQTVVVEDGWRAELTAKNHLVLTRVVPLGARARHRHRTPIR